jgi:hypothetical protein
MMRMAGTVPYLPGCLGRWPAIMGPMPAARLVALRVVAGFALLFDVGVTQWPYREFLDGVVASDPFAARFEWPHVRWSISRLVPGSYGPDLTRLLTTLAALGLITGIRVRASAVLAWAGAVSLYQDQNFAANGGDLLRTTLFLILAVAPPVGKGEAAFVPRWPATLLLVQLAVCYFMNGAFKATSPAWRDGTVLKTVLLDETWSLVPGLVTYLPDWSMRTGAWATLAWELTFPAMAGFRRTRAVALAIGATFHIGTAFTLVVGMFPIYALCYYVVFLPWERLGRSQAR